MNQSSRAPALLFVIFAVSGFSGLIYESIWTHYLKLFLGHAAYSQTLVLSIFMGGLAIGSWLASRLSVQWKHLLMAYALIEGVVGLIALVFHPAFTALTQFSFLTVIPVLESAAAVQTFKWSLAAMLIIPQSILLGMTFPLMSSGVIRHCPAAPGEHISMLYFTNSMGGAIGVLVSGFVLVPAVGLPGTMMTAGLLNIGVALVTWAVAKKLGEIENGPVVPPQRNEDVSQQPHSYRLLLLASCVTGLASFMYEIGWIRMLSLVLGASTHAFEIMLSAFILGLALGGLWIKRRIEGFIDPLPLLALVQMVMALLALSTLFAYSKTFDLMAWAMSMFARSETGYVGFNTFSHLIAMLVMVPTTFCAGMTLPLLTFAAVKRGVGEKAIGGIYASNTIGAILGILIAVHLVMPLLGAKGTILIGAALDFALGVLLLLNTSWGRSAMRVALACTSGVGALVLSVSMAELDPGRMVSSVFRTGTSRLDHEVVFLKDGKTASVSLVKLETAIALGTNGKTDASLEFDLKKPPSGDEIVQNMAGILPLSMHPAAKRAAIIGMGSGMSAHMMLSHAQLDHLDVIEIEPLMVQAARQGFSPRNARVFDDPRSHVHIEDAKTFFANHRRRYDVIVSEPSNPWVSGVSSLFTVEFYQTVSRHLESDGLLVQWVQLYEIDFRQVAAILRALGTVFGDYAIYNMGGTDMLIVAKAQGKLPPPSAHVFESSVLRRELARIGVNSVEDIHARRVASRRLIDPLVLNTRMSVNSDYFPVVDTTAAQARFLNSSAQKLAGLADAPLPIARMLDAPGYDFYDPQKSFAPRSYLFTARARAEMIREQVLTGLRDPQLSRPVLHNLAVLDDYAKACAVQGYSKQWTVYLSAVGILVAGHLNPRDLEAMIDRWVPARCRSTLHPEHKNWLDLLRAVAAQDAEAMIAKAEALLKTDDVLNGSADFHFVFGAFALGNVALGTPERIGKAWDEYRDAMARHGDKPFYLLWLEVLSNQGAKGSS